MHAALHEAFSLSFRTTNVTERHALLHATRSCLTAPQAVLLLLCRFTWPAKDGLIVEPNALAPGTTIHHGTETPISQRQRLSQLLRW